LSLFCPKFGSGQREWLQGASLSTGYGSGGGSNGYNYGDGSGYAYQGGYGGAGGYADVLPGGDAIGL
jgi:hypothetical protein